MIRVIFVVPHHVYRKQYVWRVQSVDKMKLTMRHSISLSNLINDLDPKPWPSRVHLKMFVTSLLWCYRGGVCFSFPDNVDNVGKLVPWEHIFGHFDVERSRVYFGS